MHRWQAVTIFCEDIRQEEGRKYSLMGIFPDNLNIPGVPRVLIRLAFYMRVHIDSSADIKSVSAKIVLPDGKEESLGAFSEPEIKAAQAEARQTKAPTVGLIVSAITFNMTVESAGRILAYAKVDDEEALCGSLNLVINPAATSSAPPASQSPASAQPSS